MGLPLVVELRGVKRHEATGWVAQQRSFVMVLAAFFIGLFIGGSLGVLFLGMVRLGRDSDVVEAGN
jgi:hypothetical protein